MSGTNILILLTVLFFFQSCGPFKATSISQSSPLSEETYSIDSEGWIFSTFPLKELKAGQKFKFYMNTSLLSPSEVKNIYWDHKFNNQDYCQQSHDSQDVYSVELFCEEKGVLHIFLILELSNGEEMIFTGTVDIADIQNSNNLPTEPDIVVQLDGVKLYSIHCAGCHRSIDQTSKPNKTFNAIKTAIDTNVGGMGGLFSLKKEEIEAIVKTLKR